MEIESERNCDAWSTVWEFEWQIIYKAKLKQITTTMLILTNEVNTNYLWIEYLS